MKKILLTMAAIALQLPIFAQGIEVVSDAPLPVPSKDASYSPVISPTGDYVLITSGTMKGLRMLDLATMSLTTVTEDDGAGYNAKISSDGSLIVYRQSTIKDRLRYMTIKSYSVATGKTQTVVKKSRNVSAFAAVDGTAIALDNGKVRSKRVAGEKVKSPVVAGIEDGNLMLTSEGETVKLNPLGATRYLWASVSPDGTKVLFTVPESGMVAYVCSIDGSSLTRVGRMSAPKWMGNDWVVGMVDKDNGEVITESRVVAAKIDGTSYTTLTDGSRIAMYPSATLDASTIVYNTAEGEIRIMKVKTN